MNEIVERDTTGASPFDAIRRSREDGADPLAEVSA